MSLETLRKTKEEILTLEDQIKAIRKKEKELKALKIDYYIDFFETHREDFAHLRNIPKNPFPREMHLLCDHSVLNVDSVGKIIRELIQKYEKEDYVAKRMTRYDRWENALESYPVQLPVFVIGPESHIQELDHYPQNIVIDYSEYMDLSEYPTKQPVTWITNSFSVPSSGTNYAHLIGYHDGLTFDYKNKEYILELIFSLAYYQKEHNLEQMSPQETRKVYQKIFSK